MRKLCSVFLVIVMLLSLACAEEYTPAFLAEQFVAMSKEGFPVTAEYHETGDFITMTLRSEELDRELWDIVSQNGSVESTYSLIDTLSSNLKAMLIVCGYPKTTVVSTFQLNDGTAIFLLIDGKDFSSMISPE